MRCHLNKRELFKKTIAWMLIATTVNPTFMAPAFARDSDIYLASTSGTSTAEPNVLFILGTNDRMNVAEAWREYDPVTYDSHAEYLWNDLNIINGTVIEQTTEHIDKISTAAPPTNPFSAWGTWSGALNTDRQALWMATKAYANGTQGTDPGPRSQYRNYWLASWHYWLPTGTSTTDPRLWSVSFNRFLGFVQTIAGARGGVTFPPTTANYSGANDFRGSNLCQTSYTQIEPSTIFAPTGRAQNAGFMTNQQWIRYDPYLNLTAINNPAANYPGSNATYVASNGTTYYRGFLDASLPITNTSGANVLPRLNGPGNGPNNVFRDSNGGNVGSAGQPIRVRKDIPDSASAGGTLNFVDAGDSYGGWTDPAADLGGYVFQSWVGTSTPGYYYPQTVLAALRGVYGYLTATSATANGLQLEQFAAWRGNRDSAPTFGNQVGTPAYYDISSGLRGAAQINCDPAAGPAVANQCINLAGANQNANWTQLCTPAGTVRAERDAQDTTRYSGIGLSCTNSAAGGTFSGGLSCVGPASNPTCTTPLLTAPTLNCGITNTQNVFYTRLNTTPCIWSPAQSTINVATCTWTGGRTSVYIEGQGTYFYGGSCTENGSTASCVKPSGSIAPGTYNATLTLNGVSRTDVIGPFPSPAPAAGTTTLGCGNARTAGTYSYAGTCAANPTTGQWTDPPAIGVTTTSAVPGTAPATPASQRTGVNPAACAATGGSALTIRGLAQTYNQTCGPTLATFDQTCGTRYGAACLTDGVRNNHCPASVTTTTVAIPGGSNFFQTYQINATTTSLVHECIADGPAQNPGGNSYPTNQVRTFATAANTTAIASTLYSGANKTQLYTQTAGEQVVADASKNIDVYSTNYLNFLYGAKACRDSSGALITTSPLSTPPAGATCSPIARKTRLAVAKDALSGLVATTDGVRLGLMVYDKTQGCNATPGTAGITQGDIVTGSNTLTVVDGTIFNATNAITILGAGAAGANLSTTISSKVGNVYTLATTASTTVVGAQVQANSNAFPNSNKITVVDPTQFIAGNAITVVGAGAAGANLATTISSIAGNVYTLATAMSTGVNGASVQLTTCTGGNVNDGANVAYAVRRMGSDSSDLPAYNNRQSLITAIQGVVASSRTPLTESLYEAYRYFSGRTPKWGTSSLPAGGGGVITSQREVSSGVNSDPPSVYANVRLVGPSGKYNSPMLNNPNVAGPANCQKNYIVMISNGQPEEDAAANPDIKAMVYAGATGATISPRTDYDTAGATPNNAGAPDYRQIPTVAGGSPYGPADSAGATVDGGYVWLDELSYYMSQADVSPGAANFQSEYSTCSNPVAPGHTCNGPTTTDLITGRQSIVTYTIGFAGISAPVVQNAALVSGGIYYVAQNADQLKAALVAAFIAIRNWNPTAAAATVPISSLNRGESSHDVYLAFFGPSVASTWPGTVKKYQISTLASDCGAGIPLCLVGQTQINGLYNIQTIDPVTGISVVDPTAVSGANDLNHPTGSAWQASTVQDGALPTKGGTGHVLINTAGYTPDLRKIYTYLTDSVTLYTSSTKSTTTDLTHVTNAADYITNGSKVTRCRLGDSGACNGSSTMSLATKETLLSFVRGGNLGDANCTDGSTGSLCSTWSTWPHSAVEHSKPVIVNYNSSTTPPVQYMYYLQNNGMLTAVDTSTGREKWSFLIEEALPKIASLQANANGPEIYVADGSPAVYYDDQNGDGIVNGSDRVWIYFGLRRGGRAYYALDITLKDQPFFKWKITAEQPSLNDGTMASGSSNLFVGYTANFAVGMTVKVAGAGPSGADLTANITAINGSETRMTLSTTASTTVANARIETVGTPLSAKVCSASSTCANNSAYNELGQSWSTPNVVKLKSLFGTTNNPPALIFGGGYDPAEDTVPPATRNTGRAVFIVNGDTGATNNAVLKSFGAGQGNIAADFRTANMLSTYSVPSDVTAINTDFDAQNYVDRLYVGDMGGNVWRFDVDDANPANWKGELLASLSNAAGEKRKFFFPPAVAPQDHPFNFHAVYIGSGDKEHPLLTGSTVPPTTDDRMFMLMDDPTLNSGGGTPDTGGPSALATPIVLGTLVDIADISTTGADATSLISSANSLKGRQGWSRRLQNGEKVVNATTVFRLQSQISRLRFGTYAPLVQLNACTPPGEGRLNEIDSLTGDLLAINGAAAGPQRWYSGFLSRGYMSSTQLLILPSGGVGSTKIIYQFNCADANCQGTQIGTLGAPTKIYWYLEPEQ